MSQPEIGVGIIGVTPGRSWGALAHIPALQALPGYRISAVSTTRMESAREAAEAFDVPLAFDNHRDLVNADEVDLVVVTVKVPHHRELVMAALEAGKHIYCEWPLGNGHKEAEEMTAMARKMGVKAFVGLQARSAPVINRVRDLVAEGYIGEVLSTTLVGSGMNWGAYIDEPNAYTADRRNGATLLTIPLGHTVDALCYCLGEFTQLDAVMANRREEFTMVPDGIRLPMTSEDQVVIGGLLEGGAVASVHYRGGVSRGTNLLWEINGTEGDLQITSYAGHAQMFELTLMGAKGEQEKLGPLEVPAAYREAPELALYAQNVAEAYIRAYKDLTEGTQLCPTFDDAVVRHQFLQAVEVAASEGVRQALA